MLLEKESFNEHDVVALIQDIPEFGLRKGDVGTIVVTGIQGWEEVEFTNGLGETTVMTAIEHSKLIKLHFEVLQAA